MFRRKRFSRRRRSFGRRRSIRPFRAGRRF